MRATSIDNPPPRITVICPLRFEHNALRRRLPALNMDVRVACCGPGEQGIARWGATPATAGEIVILAGLAGSLREDLHAGDARIVDAVRDEAGKTWTAPLTARVNGLPPSHSAAADAIVITSQAHVVRSAEERHALARRSGACMVDMESVAFARLATQRGWRWGIVRGVSDDPSTALPPQLATWVTPDGRTRVLAVLRSLARRPHLIAVVRDLQRHSSRALASAARLIQLLAAPDAQENLSRRRET